MSKNIKQQVESLLLVATKPLKVVKLKDFIPEATPEEIMAAVAELKEKYNQPDSGLNILENQGVIQLTTCPAVSATVKEFVKDETTGELTRPALETLTIIAYRQPISKSELEQIRGVNCSLILRNLLIRGLILRKRISAP
jgi:segregation and condensation protein B